MPGHPARPAVVDHGQERPAADRVPGDGHAVDRRAGVAALHRQERVRPGAGRVVADDDVGRRLAARVRFDVEGGVANLVDGIALGRDVRPGDDRQTVAAGRDDVVVVDPDVGRGLDEDRVTPDGTDRVARDLHVVRLDEDAVLAGAAREEDAGAGAAADEVEVLEGQVRPATEVVPDRVVLVQGQAAEIANRCAMAVDDQVVAAVADLDRPRDPVDPAGREVDDRPVRNRGDEADQRARDVGPAGGVNARRARCTTRR